MILLVLIIIVILYLYIKHPHLFKFIKNYISGKYVRLERTKGSDFITFSNLIINDIEGNQLFPISIAVNPSIVVGDGREPKASSADKLNDVVVVETATTTTTTSGNPYVEYDLGKTVSIANVIIISRQFFREKMKNLTLYILDENRNVMYETYISEAKVSYFISIC